MKKTPIFLIILSLFLTFIFAQEFNPQIDSLINQVSLDSLVKHVRILSGEDSVRIGDSTYLIKTRASTASFHETKGHRIAAKYLVKILKQYCPQVIEQTLLFRDVDTVRNIIGIQEGKNYPDKKIIVSGHYDSITGNLDLSIAPGADDNASGVASVLEAARLISQIETAYTIYYILWDWEEVGGTGSEVFCLENIERTDLLAMLNVDMIGYDVLDSGVVCIYCRDVVSLKLGRLLENIGPIYNIELNIDVFDHGVGGDCIAFWGLNICPAVHIMENYLEDWENRNPYYHTINDKIEHFNMNYFHKSAKLVIATTAELALNGLPTAIETESVTMLDQFQLFQNYPNPFNASTNITYFLPFNDCVVLRIYDLNGKLVQTISPGHQTSGIHHLLFDGSHLSSGIYFYQIQGADHSIVNKMILLK